MKTYHSVKELFALAEENHCSPGVIACRLESEESGKNFDEVWEKMKKTIPVFRQSIQRGLADTKKSASRLVGGDANAIFMRESRFLSPVSWRVRQQDPAGLYRLFWRQWRKKKILLSMM